ncbi:Ig-like domain repeat protein [Scatolibacter rhodanostii]|uniref:Ig-like domain repeat protein n=1 Tax=Scatolibacter rhodanostii TaxID=2014781 RepID=UPI000C084C20|nr:Ig-like domain repeat protein [Scatolibacter rhodanostii]
MYRKKAVKRILSFALTVLLAITMFPQTVLAEGEDASLTAAISGEITGFEPLVESVQNQTISLGILWEELTLPNTLIATVKTAESLPQAENVDNDVENSSQQVVSVTWSSEPEYIPETPNQYVFTPVLGEGYTLAKGIILPAISITTVQEKTDTQVDKKEAIVSIVTDSNEPLHLNEGQAITNDDLLTGVTAEDENGESIEVTVQNMGELDLENPVPKEDSAPYVITYAAEHPVSQEVFTATREVYVTATIMPLSAIVPMTSTTNIIDVSDSATPSGDGWTYADGVFTVTGDVTITGTTTTNRIKVASGASVNITLNDADIQVSEYYICAFDMTTATVNLTLEGSNTLKSGAFRAGLEVPTGATLLLHGTGTLSATGGTFSAGIGSSFYDGTDSGNITITGGTVIATGNLGGAGIGGGYYDNGGNIIITGGDINAKGGDAHDDSYGGGAGIGGGGAGVIGNSPPSGNITITGSANVIALGGNSQNAGGGSGIGSGGSTNEFRGITSTSGSVDSIIINTTGAYIAAGGQGVNGRNGAGIGRGGLGSHEVGTKNPQYIPETNVVAHTITTSAGTGGSISPSGAVSVINGANAAFTVTADMGYLIDTVTVGDTPRAVANKRNFTFTLPNVTADSTVTATFIRDDAKAPIITGQPQGGTYPIGSTENLTVSANMSDEGNLSYQWYSCDDNSQTNTAPISGATNASYAFNTGEQSEQYYFCIVTNTNASVSGTQTATMKSNVVKVVVFGKPTVFIISVPAVNANETLSLTIPHIYSYIPNIEITAQGWEISADGSTDWTAFNPATVMTYAHNNQYLRYYATNAAGTGYSGNTVQLMVNKLDLMLSLSCNNIIYGESPNPQLSGNVGGGTVTYTYKEQAAPNNKYTETVPTNTGNYTVRASVAATDIYNANSATANFSILRATPSIELTASPTSDTLADDEVTLTAVMTGVNANDYPTGDIVFQNGETVLGTISLVEGKASFPWQNVPFGRHNLTANYVGDSNYKIVSDTLLRYNVQKRPQAELNIIGSPETITYGDDSFDLSITGGNGNGAVTYSVQSGDAVSINDNIVTIEKAGTAVIKAVKATDNIYNETSTTITLTVEKATPSIAFTASPTSGSLADDEVILTAVMAGVDEEDHPTGNVVFKNGNEELGTIALTDGEASFTWQNVPFGTHNLTAEYIGDSNYRIVSDSILSYDVQKKNQAELTIIGNPETIVYGDDSFTLSTIGGNGNGSVTYSVQSGDAVSINDNIVTIEKAGTAVIQAVKAADSIYNETSTTITLTVEKATPSITLTASPTNSGLADDEVILTAVMAGVNANDYPTGNVVFKNGDTVLETTALTNGKASFTWENVPFGTHNLTANYVGDSNYTSATDSISRYDVQKRPQAELNIIGSPETITYGDDSFDLSITGGNGNGSVTYSVQSGDAVSVIGDTVTIEKTGTVVIQAVKAADSIYNATSTTITLTVTKARPTFQKNLSVDNAYIGKTLASLSLSDLEAYGIDNKPLSGSFAWQNPQTVIQGSAKYPVVFTAMDDNYEKATIQVQINLDKTEPMIYSIKAIPSVNAARLEVVAAAETPLSYQWQVQGSWIDIPGATTAVFDYSGLSGNQEYTVRVIVTDDNGNSTISDAITFKTSTAPITGLPESHTLNKDGTVSFSPQPTGGTWRYDDTYLIMKQDDGNYLFTAKKVGKTTMTYLVDNTEYAIQITINENIFPQTGDTNNMKLWIALLIISSAGITGIFMWKKKRKFLFINKSKN